MRASDLLLTGSLALALASPSGAAIHDMALGGSGEVYRVLSGRYDQLLPNAPATFAASPVLALDILPSGGGVARRLLVPTTEGGNVESKPYVFHEDGLDTVFIVWESRTNLIHSQINLISYGESGWSELIALSPDSWSFKNSPQIAVTTDTYQTAGADGAVVNHRRTVVHTVWWEQSDGGGRSIYSPVVLIDGSYIGWNPIQVLNDLDPTTTLAEAGVEPSLYKAPGVVAGAARGSVVVAFVNPKTGRVLNIEVDVLPWQLTELAAEIRAKVAALATEKNGNIKAIADGARAHILVSGAKWFNIRFVTSLANELYNYLLLPGTDGSDLRSLPGEARAHILIAGVEISGHTLGGGRPPRTFEIPLDAAQTQSMFLQLRLNAVLPAPATGHGMTTTLLASPGGENGLVAWEDGAVIRYRESHDGEWSEARSLVLGGDLDREHAYQILEQRLRGN
jgi:hypothetical protein